MDEDKRRLRAQIERQLVGRRSELREWWSRRAALPPLDTGSIRGALSTLHDHHAAIARLEALIEGIDLAGGGE